MADIDKSQHVLPLETPVVWLDASTAFEGLEDREKNYAYHLTRASWVGSLATFLQVSPESGKLFVLLHKIFRAQSAEELKKAAVAGGFSEDDVNAVLVYAAGIFSNAGNYKGFGDLKIIPGIEQEKLEGILKLSPAWNQVQNLWATLKDDIYDLSNGKTCLGFRPHGITTYLSSNMSTEDCKTVQEYMSKTNLGYYNTRAFKSLENGKVCYEIRLASEEKGVVKEEEVNGVVFKVTKGDYSPIMASTAKCLLDALPYAANDTQKEMLKFYARSFKSGSLDDHIDGSRFWIKDKGPVVETYIGFIENYRDPAGQRGEFEGFVAIVNKEMSKKFNVLVERAEEFLSMMPWPPCLEKDKFSKPDFTSLDVLCFAGSGLPIGINIPNYDEVRQAEGFKNVSLGNVLPASFKSSKMDYLSEADKQLMEDLRVASFEVQVGLHELLGHGSGKLLRQETDGTFNFDRRILNPLTGEPISSWYKPGDTWDTVFSSLGSPFEECRAEAVGLFLSVEPKVLEIFGLTDNASDITYINWLSMAWAGLMSLEMWDPNRGWLQAHSQARFALLNVLLQGSVAKIEQPTPEDLLVSLDRSIILGVGRQVIGHFLLQMQVFKASADIDSAKKLFEKYTAVSGKWLEYRKIVLAGKKPRRMFTQPNPILCKKTQRVTLNKYDPSPEGLITSWMERYPELLEENFDYMIETSNNDAHFFKVNKNE